MASFEITYQVRFADTDQAGIVFYPRYFEMINLVVEEWFAKGLGYPWGAMIREHNLCTPTVHLDADFIAPSFFEDKLKFTLAIEQLGRTSCSVLISASCKDEKRLSAKIVLVFVNISNYKAHPFFDDMKEKMKTFMM